MEIDSISSRKVTVLVEVIGNGGKPVVNDLCHLKEGRMFLFLLSNHLLIIALPILCRTARSCHSQPFTLGLDLGVFLS